jgi:hypothetical protein
MAHYLHYWFRLTLNLGWHQHWSSVTLLPWAFVS